MNKKMLFKVVCLHNWFSIFSQEKFKNFENTTLFETEMQIILQKDKKITKIMINNPIEQESIQLYLNFIDHKLFMELDNEEKISLINFTYFTEIIESQMYSY